MGLLLRVEGVGRIDFDAPERPVMMFVNTPRQGRYLEINIYSCSNRSYSSE